MGARQDAGGENPIQKTTSSNVLDALVKYIPTESVTLYLAATAALSSLTQAFPVLTADRLYWTFVVLTPILFALIYFGKRLSQKLPFMPAKTSQFPWWKLFASTAAFAVWALAIAPLAATDAGKITTAIGALFASTALSLFGAVVEPLTEDGSAT